PALEACHLAFEALGGSGRAHPRLAVAIARDGVPGELRFEVRRPVRRAPPLSVIGPVRPHTAKATRDFAPEFAATRRVRHGQLDLPRSRRRLVEVAGAQTEELASFAQREHLRGAPAASFV